jgi:polyisoprenoid-binding protein YceI
MGEDKNMNLKRWIIVGIGVLLLAFVVAPFVYTKFIEGDAPDKLSVAPATGKATGAATPIDGTWKAGTGSQAGYRVKEVLFGQSVEAVGRTDSVTGDATADGAKITKATFTVDMASVKSDRDQRDGQFRGRIMNVDQFPTSTFALTSPIDLGSIPAVGGQVKAKATGTLTLKGKANPVTFDVTASRTGSDTFEASGQIPVAFADYGVQNPSFGGIEVQDTGQVEFLLKFTK